MSAVQERYSFKYLTATALVKVGEGGIAGIFVSTASSTPTITVYDELVSSGTTTKIVNTFTPVAGQYYPMPFAFKNGLVVAISGTVTCTVGFA